jgi:hypothetical protein
MMDIFNILILPDGEFSDPHKIIATITGLGLLMWEKLKEQCSPVSSREEHNRVIQELEDRINAFKTAGSHRCHDPGGAGTLCEHPSLNLFFLL